MERGGAALATDKVYYGMLAVISPRMVRKAGTNRRLYT